MCRSVVFGMAVAFSTAALTQAALPADPEQFSSIHESSGRVLVAHAATGADVEPTPGRALPIAVPLPLPEYPLQAGFDPMAHGEPGRVDPLHWAALQNQTAILQRLIERGRNPDMRDGAGRTPLMAAAAFGSREAANVLLSAGADPGARDRAGDAPIHFAARAGHREIVRMLFAHGVDAEQRATANGATALHLAAKYGHRNLIEFLVGSGADPNVTDYDGVSPIFYASKRQLGATVELLTTLGARPGGLHEAVNANDVASVHRLLSSGADANALGLDGTPLHLAVAKGYVWIARTLLDAGADIEAVGDPSNMRPLHIAALTDQAVVVDFLIERGTVVEARDDWGRTPLMIAAAHGATDTARTLLDRGADPSARDGVYGEMPIHIAAWSGKVEILRSLLARGVDINSRSDHNGEAPLHYAAQYGKLAAIRYLLANGADLDRGDDEGYKPLDYACFKGNTGDSASRLLTSLGAQGRAAP